MAPTLEPSPTSSATSSDDDHPFFSALSTSPYELPQLIPYTPFHLDNLMSAIEPKVPLLEDDACPYTLPSIYPMSYSSGSSFCDDSPAQSPPTSPEFCSSILEKQSHPKEPPVNVVWGRLPPHYPETILKLHLQTKLRRHQRSDSLPSPAGRQIYRHNQPSLIKFPDTLPLNKPQLHGLRSPHPCRLSNSIGTEALISLAWTGEVSSPIVASGYVPSSIGNTYMWPKLKISDTTVTVTRRASWPDREVGQGNTSKGMKDGLKSQCHLDPNSSSRSRYHRSTLANAISDDGVTDEKLVELLEELRLRGQRSNERSTFRFQLDPPTPTDEAPTRDNPEPPDLIELSPQSGGMVSDDVFKNWCTARRALFVCRELIRTERHYLAALHILAEGETQSPPPPLMTARLPALIQASSHFLDMMEANPSVLGVSSAFIQAYEDLEIALVQWCEVVGKFFTTPDILVKRSNSAPAGSGTITGQSGPTSLTKRVGSWSKKMHYKGSVSIDDITSLVARTAKSKTEHKPAVRDLAILPTQRITRYVLLLKDLLVHTPTSMDIRSVIERAADGATKLAQKADRAQDHAAFRMDSSV